MQCNLGLYFKEQSTSLKKYNQILFHFPYFPNSASNFSWFDFLFRIRSQNCQCPNKIQLNNKSISQLAKYKNMETEIVRMCNLNTIILPVIIGKIKKRLLMSTLKKFQEDSSSLRNKNFFSSTILRCAERIAQYNMLSFSFLQVSKKRKKNLLKNYMKL